jgi:hypothetical protein
MNPTLEVQITARLDKLDAALKVAEAKIGASAVTMGKTGEQGGSMFVDKMVGNMVKGLAMGAISNVLGNGILTALQGVNAGKGGQEIGLDIAKGIVDGAKGIPIVGTIVSIFDEIVNGANRAIEKLQVDINGAVKSYMDAWDKMKSAREGFMESAKTKAEDVAVMDSPESIIRLSAVRQKEDARKAAANAAEVASAEQIIALQKKQSDEMQALKTKQNSESFTDMVVRTSSGSTEFEDQISALQKQQQNEREATAKRSSDNSAAIETALNVKLVSIEDEKNKKLKEMKDKASADDKASGEKLAAENKKNIQATVVAELAQFKEYKQKEYEAAVQAQQDIIDANKEAQAQIDKIGRVDQMAGQAAQGMISSGQTALGQFNFAQAGAGGTALEMAKKQVESLQKIEDATAEQVRLTKENKGFQ